MGTARQAAKEAAAQGAEAAGEGELLALPALPPRRKGGTAKWKKGSKVLVPHTDQVGGCPRWVAGCGVWGRRVEAETDVRVAAARRAAPPAHQPPPALTPCHSTARPPLPLPAVLLCCGAAGPEAARRPVVHAAL